MMKTDYISVIKHDTKKRFIYVYYAVMSLNYKKEIYNYMNICNHFLSSILKIKITRKFIEKKFEIQYSKKWFHDFFQIRPIISIL